MAEMLQHVPLSKQEAFSFSLSPADTKDPWVCFQLIKFAKVSIFSNLCS